MIHKKVNRICILKPIFLIAFAFSILFGILCLLFSVLAEKCEQLEWWAGDRLNPTPHTDKYPAPLRDLPGQRFLHTWPNNACSRHGGKTFWCVPGLWAVSIQSATLYGTTRVCSLNHDFTDTG